MSVNAIELRKVRDFGEVLNTTFAFLRENFVNIIKSCATLALPIGLAGAVLLGFAFNRFFIGMSANMTSVASSPEEMFGGMMVYFPVMLLGMLLLGVGALIFYVSVYQYIALYLTYPKEQLTFQLVWSHAKGKIFPLLGLGIIVMLILFVGMIPFFIPFIYMVIPLSFVYIIYMVEKIPALSTIGRSFNLITGEWWNCLALAFIMIILQYAVSLVISLPLNIITGGMQMHDLDAGNAEAAASEMFSKFAIMYAIFIPASYLLSFLTGTMQMICISIKYFSIIESREGVGMMEKVQQMQTGTPGAV